MRRLGCRQARNFPAVASTAAPRNLGQETPCHPNRLRRCGTVNATAFPLAGTASVAVDRLVGFRVGGLLDRPLRYPWKPRPAWRLRTRQQVRASGFGRLFCPWWFHVSWHKVAFGLGCGFTRASISSPNITFERDWPISVLFLRPVVIELSGLRPSFAVGQPLNLNVRSYQVAHRDFVLRRSVTRHYHRLAGRQHMLTYRATGCTGNVLFAFAPCRSVPQNMADVNPVRQRRCCYV